VVITKSVGCFIISGAFGAYFSGGLIAIGDGLGEAKAGEPEKSVCCGYGVDSGFLPERQVECGARAGGVSFS